MKSLQVLGGISGLALAISGCSTWDSMGYQQHTAATAPSTQYYYSSPPISDRRLSTAPGTTYDSQGNSDAAYQQEARVSGYGNNQTYYRSAQPQPYGTAQSSQYYSNRPYASMSGNHADMNDRSFVRSVQRELNEQGYRAGPVDGIIGPRTTGAIRHFQDANGLPATGRLDSATVATLGVEQPYGSNVARTSPRG